MIKPSSKQCHISLSNLTLPVTPQTPPLPDLPTKHQFENHIRCATKSFCTKKKHVMIPRKCNNYFNQIHENFAQIVDHGFLQCCHCSYLDFQQQQNMKKCPFIMLLKNVELLLDIPVREGFQKKPGKLSTFCG